VVAATYAAGVVIGAISVHANVELALRVRDRTVSKAQSSSILIADREGRHLHAAVLDFAANLGLGAVPSTIVGALFSPGLYPLAVYRGWIGGIVSVDRRHTSRLRVPRTAAYYLTVLVLQLIPYSLAGAAGLVLARARRAVNESGLAGWRRIPRDTWLDVAWMHGAATMLFFLASFVEFVGPWR
jgi:hypothetical protein